MDLKSYRDYHDEEIDCPHFEIEGRHLTLFGELMVFDNESVEIFSPKSFLTGLWPIFGH